MIGALRRGVRVAAQGAAYALVVYLVVLVVLRPWQRDWGSSDEERRRRLPGDEESHTPERAGDRAIAIDAPAEAVWSWLVQIGQDRGGFYSYASLENLFGVRVNNATHVVPGWQTLQRGDFVRAVPPDWLGGVFGERIGWEVDHVEPGRLLALRYWQFEVEPTSATTSRLHVRTHAGDAPVPLAPVLFMVFEPAHFIMERAMLRGIKARAEQGPDLSVAWVDQTDVNAGDEVLVRFAGPVEGVAVDQRWVTLAPSEAPLTDTRGRVVIERGARSIRLRTSYAGPHEVRIYDRYPEKESHLLTRIPVDVGGYRVQTGSEPMPAPRDRDP